MQPPIASRRQVVDRLEHFTEASLFPIPAFDGDRFNRVVGFDQPLCSAFQSLSDDIGMDGGMDQLVEA